jgi:hypothetical protein
VAVAVAEMEMEMEMVVAVPSPEVPAEEERALIRDITVAAEAHAKEGDTFFLITHRSRSPSLVLPLSMLRPDLVVWGPKIVFFF